MLKMFVYISSILKNSATVSNSVCACVLVLGFLLFSDKKKKKFNNSSHTLDGGKNTIVFVNSSDPHSLFDINAEHRRGRWGFVIAAGI